MRVIMLDNFWKTILLDSRKIMNPQDPPRLWTVSKRISHALERQLYRYIWPDSLEEAAKLLRQQFAAGIVLSDESVINPFPNGIVWFKIPASIDAMREAGNWISGAGKQHLSYYYAQGFRWFLGNAWWQDGGKFITSARTAAHAAKTNAMVFILERDWLSKFGDDVMREDKENGSECVAGSLLQPPIE